MSSGAGDLIAAAAAYFFRRIVNGAFVCSNADRKRLRFLTALWLGKIAVLACRVLGRGGTDMPGRLALKICPDVLKYLSSGVNTVLITGTNGKTTTSRIVERGLAAAGLDCFANRSGANLLSGIVTCFASNAKLSGKSRHDWAVIECDEAALKFVTLYIKPVSLTVTNIFRDQLDRYGEVTHTLSSIRTSVANIPGAVLCLNADCSLTWSAADDAKNAVISFGVDVPIYRGEVSDLSDAPYCSRCKSRYNYDYRTFGHLGGWRCSSCENKRHQPDIRVTRILSSGESGTAVVMSIFDSEYTARINLAGGYNVYNACAAAACLHSAGVGDGTVIEALGSFEGGFGRMEEFSLGGVSARMILVKNPAGCNQVINYLCSGSGPAQFVICLNDRAADGTDISWIWDVEFENLAARKDRLTGLWVSGVRADDMALRLKYAGFDEGELRVIRDYNELLDEIAAQSSPVYIMPTYTAMMDLRGIMTKRFKLKKFWM